MSDLIASHLAAPARLQRRPYLYIDVQHGLANRLRALASGAVLAQATQRQLVLLWQPDAHCQARFHDLFAQPIPVIEEDPAGVLRASAAQVYNYMEIEPGACFQEPIFAGRRDLGGDVYIRSAYTLSSPLANPAAERAFLRGLTLDGSVAALLAPFAGQRFAVAAHIRMATGQGFDHLAWESPDNWPEHRHQELSEWRGKSHVERFLPRLDALLSAQAGQSGQSAPPRLFVAADLPETYDLLRARYGAQFTCLARDSYDRSVDQVRHALADMIVLSRAERFLASSWSAFSDMAQRLAPGGRAVERSGIDF